MDYFNDDIEKVKKIVSGEKYYVEDVDAKIAETGATTAPFADDGESHVLHHRGEEVATRERHVGNEHGDV